ncbi:hypothetical protein [Bacillus cereus]|uniref:hypothetical protein n=1 Tax=Bacillus cereus TaxID=1396 RepID=UPI000279E47F|nr:hypothetical protein [Bacillus cereus]EJR95294.1 hypothetical protein IKG_03835 [Bacillus cereus VD200]
MNDKVTKYQASEINGITVPARGTQVAHMGIGSLYNKKFATKMIGYKYEYDGGKYPKTVVPTEVYEVSDTQWDITFYNMHDKESVNITVKSIIGSTAID